MTEEEFEVFLTKKAEEILNIAADRVVDEVVDRVMEEKEEEPNVEGKEGVAGQEREKRVEE